MLLNDRDWAQIDGDICRVARFDPLATVIDGRVKSPDITSPYALVSLECSTLSPDTGGAITHTIDFLHLWSVFFDRGVREGEEVCIARLKSRLTGLKRPLARFLPGLSVMVCKAGAYELMTQPDYRPELRGEARYRAEAPVQIWTPTILS